MAPALSGAAVAADVGGGCESVEVEGSGGGSRGGCDDEVGVGGAEMGGTGVGGVGRRG